jgi:hypothetical protein
MDLYLNVAECELVLRILRGYLANLRSEISHLESSAYRKELKAEEEDLMTLRAKLETFEVKAG